MDSLHRSRERGADHRESLSVQRLFRLGLGNRSVRREVAQELQFHLDRLTDEFIAAGMSPDAARRAALDAFGDREDIERDCVRIRTGTVRKRRRAHTVRGAGQDLRFAFRTLRRAPGFTLAVLVTMALGIGANTAVFSLISGILLAPLPFDDEDRLVRLVQSTENSPGQDAGLSPLEIADYRARATALSDVVEYHTMSFILFGHGDPQRVQTGVVSASFFSTFGIEPFLGRLFEPHEDDHGADPVLILSHAFWQQNFGADPTVIGRTVEMNDRPHTIIGVLPPLPYHPDHNVVYMPVPACPFRSGTAWSTSRDARSITVYAKLGRGETLESAQADVAAISEDLYESYPAVYPSSQGFRTAVMSLRESMTAEARTPLFFLLGASGFLLLIVCANVANLTLARLVGRSREMAVRTALGAGRVRLFRQLFTESTILALAGGALGLVVAVGGLELLVPFVERYTARAAEVRIDGVVLLFTLVVSIAAALVLGSLPALPRQRPSTDLRSLGGSARLGARRWLIVSQVAICFFLLIGAGLFLRSFLKLVAVDPGFDHESVMTARFDLNWSSYNSAENVLRFVNEIDRRLRSEPAIRHAGVANAAPLSVDVPNTFEFAIKGQPAAATSRNRSDSRTVSPEYFQAMGIPVLRGRTFTGGEYERGDLVVVINQALADLYWPDANPLGALVMPNDGENAWHTVVGVVGDVREYGLDREPGPLMYANFGHDTMRDFRLIVRAESSPDDLAMTIREIARVIDPEQPVTEVETLSSVRQDVLQPPRLITLLLTFFALVALGITAAGIAGVIGYSVSCRTQEIGVRMALGAQRRSVVALVVRQVLVMVSVGLGAGVVGAIFLGRVFADLLFDTAATDPMTFVTVSILLVAVALAASFAPARRATSIDPATALRAD